MNKNRLHEKMNPTMLKLVYLSKGMDFPKGDNMKHSLGKLVMATVLSLGLAGTALAKGRPGKGEFGGKGEHVERMIKELNLNEEQKVKVKQIRDTYESQIRTLRESSKVAAEDLKTTMKQESKGPEFQKAALDKFAVVQQKRQELQKLRFQMALETRELLNGDQLKKFNSFHDKRGPRGGMDRDED